MLHQKNEKKDIDYNLCFFGKVLQLGKKNEKNCDFKRFLCHFLKLN